eukprot:TRINITY_DN9327_c0_g1_i1.p1 TRINITY_DN9327_c0_g1~~TRINITY_DN9327_c0_g1_i1.p1  ORF type:complete len:490 (+),score=37.93 TRINITY_DN9327_c0_g1_i1:172-1470(+)
MQLGFAFLEAGNLRIKHVTNMLMKVVLDGLLAALGWWALGFAFAFGERVNHRNGFIGTTYFFTTEMPENNDLPELRWFFYWTLCTASTTIVSGGVAGRAKIQTYLGFTLLMSMWVFALPCHWLWSGDGWLSANNPDSALSKGAIDFAGGCVVHLLGGISGLVGAVVIGPQENRFTGQWDGAGEKGKINVYRSMWTAFGTFLLWFGWYGFNLGSLFRISSQAGYLAGKIGLNTTLAGAGGSVLPLLVNRYLYKSWDLNVLLNGILAGFVSVTSCCVFINSWAAFLTGVIGGATYYGISHFLLRLKVDDPLNAAGIHAACGSWSMISCGFFARQDLVVLIHGPSFSEHYGAFLGGNGKLLGLNCLAVVTVASWSFLWSLLYFGLTKWFGVLRISAEEERYGLDVIHHMHMTTMQRNVFRGGSVVTSSYSISSIQ